MRAGQDAASALGAVAVMPSQDCAVTLAVFPGAQLHFILPLSQGWFSGIPSCSVSYADSI